jgi:GH25 family lysozyme M1 (1,4-beta-N-acetylmuramidase)
MVTPAARKFQVGVDVSSYQGPPPDWKSAAGNFSWAAVKITELEPNGTRYVNPDAAADWAWLRSNKKGRIAYLFGHPSVSAADTVAFFISQVSELGLRDRDGIALDLETADGESAPAVDSWALSVLEELARKLGRSPLLYTFLDFAEAGNCNRLGHYPLWIADPSSKAGHPRVPAPWKTWSIHQYVITGQIDRDVANYTSQQAMFNVLGKPEEPDMRNLGGSIVGALASARWPGGVTVVAGLGTNGLIQSARWENGEWSAWTNVSSATAQGAPGLISIGSSQGHLYYTDTAGTVVELDTTDTGQTWS